MSHWKSIWRANSRDFLRSDMLPAPRLRAWARGRLDRAAKLLGQMRHLDGRERGFISLVPALESGAVNGLLKRVAGEHAKNNGHAGVHLRELQAARGLRTHIIVVRSLSANHAPDSDERVVSPRRG